MEKNNNIQVNVFGLEEKVVYPLRLSKDPQSAINLMLLQDGQKTHWVWVKNFSRLCADKTKHKATSHFCMRCLSGHNTEDNLQNHLRYCQEHPTCTVHMPKPGTKLKFKNHHKQLKSPYVSKNMV